MNRFFRSALFPLIVIVLLVYLASQTLIPKSKAPRKVTYSELIQKVQECGSSCVQEVVFSPSKRQVTAQIIGQDKKWKVNYPSDQSQIAFQQILQRKHVTFDSKGVGSNPWWSILTSLLPFVLLFGFWIFLMNQVQGGGSKVMSFGKSRAKRMAPDSPKIGFKDVAGVDEAVEELHEIKEFLENPKKFQALGARIPKGVLLYGPPGTGKTLLARAVAGEADVPFFSISGSEFVELFVGMGAARVRDLFDQAKQKAPCIVFIDEIDAIGKARSAGRGVVFGHDEREQTLNQLLVEMDGFDPTKGVVIMAATNTPEVLDPALLRAGRFDRQIVVDRPDLKGREEILRVHARKAKLAPNADLRTIAARTPGMVGADLANIINEAALLAARRGADQVEQRDLEEAIDRVMLGLEKKSRCMSPEEKQRVAYHESGHALVALSVEHADPVHRVSIIPRSIGALGHMLQLPTQERYLLTKPELEDRIAVMLGGRGAEDLVYAGVVSTGASDDLQRASELARQMVTQYGMSRQLGNLTYGVPASQRFLAGPFADATRNYSERTAEQIDDEVRAVVDSAYSRVKQILERRRRDLERMAAELVRKETLDRLELQRLIEAPVGAPQEVSSS